MPLYSYYCQDRHETDKYCSMASRPDSVACVACGEDAVRRPSVSMHQSNTVVQFSEKKRLDKSRARRQEKNYIWRDVFCRDEVCGDVTVEDIDLVDGKVPDVEFDCKSCGGPTDVRMLLSIDRFSERFPYYDRGLGVMLTSKQHRRDVCRERGLTPVDGDWDIEKEYRVWDDRRDREIRDWDKYQDRLDNHPAFRGYRRSRDLGIL